MRLSVTCDCEGTTGLTVTALRTRCAVVARAKPGSAIRAGVSSPVGNARCPRRVLTGCVRRSALLAVLLALAVVAPASAREPWPPPGGSGQLYVHMGEEHWNDEDGLSLLPKVVADSIKFRPDLVTMSGDKANDGRTSELTRWRDIMAPYDRAGIPYFAGHGQPRWQAGHAREDHRSDRRRHATARHPLLQAGLRLAPVPVRRRPALLQARPVTDLTPLHRSGGSLDPLLRRPRALALHLHRQLVLRDRQLRRAAEPVLPRRRGQHVAVQVPRAQGREAKRAGKRVFVVMHMPTRDPRDQGHSTPGSGQPHDGQGRIARQRASSSRGRRRSA